MRTRPWKSALLAGMLMLGAAVATPRSAEATTLAPLTVEQMTDASTWVVRGQVTRVWTEMDENGLIWTRAELAVGHVLKGAGDPETLVIDSLGGTYGDVRMKVWSAARFSQGEEMLVFLDELPSGRLSPVSMFQGKFTVRRPPGEDRQIAVLFQGNPDDPYDHRFLSHPAPEKRVYIDDIMNAVETRLDTGWDGKPIPGISAERLQKINAPTLRRRN